MPFDLQFPDLVTIGFLVVLEGLLSADNALVMAIMVLGLPQDGHQKALRYGLVGGFVFRIAATVLAASLIKIIWIKLAGGLYLAYLTWSHFSQGGDAESRREPPRARAGFWLPVFWATVLRIEIVNLAFSIDSILVAVAMSRKLAVILTGGILGILAMRIVVGQLLDLIRRYPALVDGAFVIIGWIAFKMIAEYAHDMSWVAWEIPRSLSLGLIVVIFAISFFYARRQAPGPASAHPPVEGQKPLD